MGWRAPTRLDFTALAFVVVAGCTSFDVPARFDGGAASCDECAYGCGDGGIAAGCLVPVPSYVGDENQALLYAEGTKDVVIDDFATLDTDTGEIKMGDATLRAAGVRLDASSGIGFLVVAQSQANAPPLGVFYMKSLTIRENVGLGARGTAALVILASQTIDIAGGLDASAEYSGPAGPGGRSSGLGIEALDASDGSPSVRPIEPAGLQLLSGAGGGANGDAGGNGGPGFETEGGMLAPRPGGVANTDFTSLRGGGSGGMAAGGLLIDPMTCCAEFVESSGGGGGGAVLLAAGETITIEAGGGVAAGGGGAPGPSAPSYVGPGAGGGAGGTIILEAPAVRMRGRLIAAGGAGGGGDDSADMNALNAEGGFSLVPSDDVPPTYALSLEANGSAGANGELASGTPSAGGNGSKPMSTTGKAGLTPVGTACGGGGGGGAGIIRIRTLNDQLILEEPEVTPNTAELFVTSESMPLGTP